MLILPFTKKAQARDIALEQLRPLLALQRVPADFWNRAYAVSFLLGWVEGVTKLLVGEQKATIDYVSNVQTGVLSALAPQEMESWPQRAARWRGSQETVEGVRNGKFIAMFLHGDSRADATELAVEAFRQARERAPVFDQMKSHTNERGRAAIILCEILFFDKINGSPTPSQRPVEPVRRAEPEAPPVKRPEPPTAPTGAPPQVPDLYSRARAELEAGSDALGARTIAALEAERRNGGINDVIEAELFARLFTDDQEKLGGSLAIKDIVEASNHAGIVFKFTQKEISEPQMYAQLDAARGKFTKDDVTEAEIFVKSLGQLEAERGKLTGKDIMEAKMFAKFFARAFAKVRAEPDVDTSTQRPLPEPKVEEPGTPVRDEPRAARAQRQGFSVNEFVVYPAHGVGQILAIEEQDIAGAKLELFIIHFGKERMTLRVPTAKVANVGMRKLSDPATVNKAQLLLAGKPHVPEGQWSRTGQEYEAKINSGDIIAIAEAVRDLYRPAIIAGQSYAERQLYEVALDRLAREVSVVQHITESEAIKDIESILIARPRQWSTAPEDPPFRVATMDPHGLPPSHGNVWLDGDELWFTTPSKDFSFDGRSYHISGGAICFPKHNVGREALLKTLRSERDLWASGDEAALKARLIQRAEQSRN
jgi:CarD family transcriptional regulator